MKWFANMRIAKKLVLSFFLVSLVAGAVGVVGITNMRSIDAKYADLYRQFGLAVGELGQVGMNFHKARTYMRDAVLNMGDPAKQQDSLDSIKASDQIVASALKNFDASIQTEELREKFSSLKEKISEYNVFRDRVVELAMAGDREGAMRAMADGAGLSGETNALIDEIYDDKNVLGASRSEQYAKQALSAIYTMVVIVAAAMAAAIGLGWAISRMIGRPVTRLAESANRIAEGDLSLTVEVASKDEIGALSAAFAKMTDNMNEVLSQIQSASEQVSSGARQMSESSLVLSQGASEQASSVEQLTASLEQIAAQTQLNADNAVQASSLAERARGNAVQGNARMREMLKAMEDINDSSASISKIIKVIDEIAFQTNILALNAAVEAARAGQHGKGFAVVAEEVRNLAARSANAAKETTEMIEGSIRKVEGGTRIASETAASLDDIVEGVAQVAAIVGNISRASTEQAAGVSQINQGIMQVSQVVQTNSATSEESAAASEELTGQAEMLKEQVAKFVLRRPSRSPYGREAEPLRLDSEMLRMLRNMPVKHGRIPATSDAFRQDPGDAAGDIVLSDREFDKY